MLLVRSARFALVCVLSFALVGCGGPAQMAAGGVIAAGGLGLGIYGISITPDRCRESRGFEATFAGNCGNVRDLRPGDPQLGVPILITSAVLLVTGGILMVTAHPRPRSGTIH